MSTYERPRISPISKDLKKRRPIGQLERSPNSVFSGHFQVTRFAVFGAGSS